VKRFRGANHLDLVEATEDIGALLIRHDLVREGLEAYMEVWRICTLHHSRNHPKVGWALWHIGKCYLMLGSTLPAIDCWTETLRLQRLLDSDGRNHDDDDTLDPASVMKRLGDAHMAAGNSHAAQEYYQNALDTEQNRAHTDLHALVTNLWELGSGYLAERRVDRAMISFAITSRRILEHSEVTSGDLYSEFIKELSQRQLWQVSLVESSAPAA
jgi:tetratricopeptide (TPR) repeat protein